MRMSRRAFGATVMILGIVASGVVRAPRSIHADVAAPLDTPYTLVASDVHDFTSAATKIFWHSRLCEATPPSARGETPTATAVEKISRIAAQGSETRTLEVQSAPGYCEALSEPIKSNLAADSQYVFWNTAQGLRRLSTNANLFDSPTLLTADTASASDAELATASGYVYALTADGGATTKLWRVAKSGGAATLLHTITGSARSLQVSSATSRGGSNYAYWLLSGSLWRLNLDANIGRDNPTTIASNVYAYFAEGARTSCIAQFCTTTDYVFYSSGTGGRTLNRLENSTAVATQIYDAGSSTKTIYGIASTASYVFFLVENAVPCSPFPCFGGTYTDSLVRTTRSGLSATTLAVSREEYLSPQSVFTNLAIAADYVVWMNDDEIHRLPHTAGAVPNLYITGMSITQGIQKPGLYPQVEKKVRLIQGRRTFVRLFVKSGGANVSGVTARLRRITNGGAVIDSIAPVNASGTQLTVRSNPSRAILDDSFLFEIPMSWLPTSSSSSLYLRADLNPFQAPTEPSYSDNALLSGPLAFQTSPALKVQFVSWGYEIGGTTYWPRYVEDIVQTYSWLIRAFPIASKITFDGGVGSQPGLHPNLWLQFDNALGSRVNQSHKSCTDNLCASAYTNSQMNAMRSEEGISDSRFFYGFISDAAGIFPRGQACCGTNVSSGPAGKSGGFLASWDTDGAYTDWYAAHEIGHTLERAHPTAGASCGNSSDDDNYPYTGAQIGPNDNAEGFDAGATNFGIARAVYPGTQWFDVMSYCDNQWISDYTYEGMHDYMLANPSRPAARSSLDGDFLSVSGRLYAGSAAIDSLWRSASVDATTTPTPGGYSIRLLDAADVQLADHPFAPQPSEGSSYSPFHGVIPFAEGTRMVEIVRTSDGTVLGAQPVSPNAPTVDAVALIGAAEPITGTVTLTWNATDADGDALTYSVLYSTDAGTKWGGSTSGITQTTTSIDTAVLGGGAGRFRVVASDGVNTGRADSIDYTIQAKPPMPFILSPGAGQRLQYGQLVHLDGTALDWQTGGVSSANLSWSSSLSGALGTGEQIDVVDLPVGEQMITLLAMNNAGLTATAEITLVVADELDPPGPTLIAGPLAFHWQLAKNAATPVTDTLYVGNAGSGALSWEVTTDAPWLSLSVSSGADIADIVLTADPSSVANGSVVSGTLTLSKPATDDAPAQTIAIPVSLSKGTDWANPNGYLSPKRVYVPAAVR